MSHDTPHIADRADNDPREDPEALLIAALLWNRDTTQAINLTQTLTPADFYSTDYAAIFATISQQLKSGRPYDGPDPGQWTRRGVRPELLGGLNRKVLQTQPADLRKKSKFPAGNNLSTKRSWPGLVASVKYLFPTPRTKN